MRRESGEGQLSQSCRPSVSCGFFPFLARREKTRILSIRVYTRGNPYMKSDADGRFACNVSTVGTRFCPFKEKPVFTAKPLSRITSLPLRPRHLALKFFSIRRLFHRRYSGRGRHCRCRNKVAIKGWLCRRYCQNVSTRIPVQQKSCRNVVDPSAHPGSRLQRHPDVRGTLHGVSSNSNPSRLCHY